jgi:hypothetical protein
MMHPTFGLGEVTAVIEPQKIDVLFSDRVRRLAHARADMTTEMSLSSRDSSLDGLVCLG